MGIAEIQAAFAASQPPAPSANPFGVAPAPAPFAAQLAPAQPSPAFPAPVFNQPPSNPFAPAAAPIVLPGVVQAPAPAPAPFAFTPPAGFVPASAPPINPVGERQSLNTAAPVEAAAVVAPVEPTSEPKRRTRKPKAGATNAGGMPGLVAPAPEQMGLAETAALLAGFDEGHPVFAKVPAEVDQCAASLTTEQIVQFLVDRGYTVRLERA